MTALTSPRHEHFAGTKPPGGITKELKDMILGALDKAIASERRRDRLSKRRAAYAAKRSNGTQPLGADGRP